MPLITILTATYNRAQMLYHCFESLQAQTCTDFEWLIIDDGSTDETERVVHDLCSKDTEFQVIYKKKKNGGKHTALNFSHEYINGQLVFMVDDDDQLIPKAVEIISNAWEKYRAMPDIGCICFQKGYDVTKSVCSWKMENEKISNYIDYRIKNNYGGDCAEVVRTDVFKEFPFPVFKNEKFLAEGHLWISMSAKYKTVYFSQIIYICDYLEGGLSKQGKTMRLKNPLGGMYISQLYFDLDIPLRVKLKKILLYDVYAIASKKFNLYVKKSNKYILCLLLSPVAFLSYSKWKEKPLSAK